MKRIKFPVWIKELGVRIKRELREDRFRIATTIIFSVSMAFFVVMLGMFINDGVRKFLVSEELYFPIVNTLSPVSPWSKSPHFSCNPASISLSRSTLPPFNSSARDWMAPPDLWHSMSDKELLWRASMAPRIAEFPSDRTRKVAFLFLTRGWLPLAPVWEMFFKGHEGLFSIYVHTSPEFTNEPPESSVFYKRRIPSQPVQWGRASMIDAERRLLANALLDLWNERFVLLSETCIPLFNFTTIYNYLVNSRHSFLGSFDEPGRIGRGRYNKRMWPTISLSDWRKGSQWFEVGRNVAIRIVSDVKYYPVFKDLCRPPCYMDEHYLPTLITKVCPELTSNRTVTWADWSGGGSHPARFMRRDVSSVFLSRVRHGFNCTYNGGFSSICFLFARKFHPSALQRLLQMAPGLYGLGP